jgi:hypothetical protein
MNKQFVIFLFLWIAVCIGANPLAPNIMSELWYNQDGHLLLEICPLYFWAYGDLQLSFSNGDIIVAKPDSLIIPADGETAVWDISAAMPELNLNPHGDTLGVRLYSPSMGFTMDWESISWGSSTASNVSLLATGQSWVCQMVHGDMGSWSHWCKEEIATPNAYPYTSRSRAWLNLRFIDASGNPYSQVEYYATNLMGVTDSTGVVADSILTGHLQIIYRIPSHEHYTYLPPVFLEPDQVYDCTVNFSGQDNQDTNLHPQRTCLLKIYPSPYLKCSGEATKIEYIGKLRLTPRSIVKIYNSKGQFIESIAMPENGKVQWQPKQGLSTGVYLLRVVSENRIVATSYLTVIK